MPEDTTTLALYTFSALIQADAAIFGLFAIFLVYQLQTLGNSQVNSISIASSHGPAVKNNVERLMLPIPPAEIHSILFKFRQSAYYNHLLTIAFANHWKQAAIKTSKPMFAALIVHASISSFGLYSANKVEAVLRLEPNIRIQLGLISFILLLIAIAVLGYRSFSQDTQTIPIPPPLLDIKRISSKELRQLFPPEPSSQYLYSIEGVSQSRFLLIGFGDRNSLRLTCILKRQDLTFVSTHSADNLPEDKLNEFLERLKKDPDSHWTHPSST